MYLRIKFSFLLILFFFPGRSQPSFTIHGKIERLTKSKSVIVSGSFGQLAGLINNDDGAFEIKGTVQEPGVAFIRTDRLGNTWVVKIHGRFQHRADLSKLAF